MENIKKMYAKYIKVVELETEQNTNTYRKCYCLLLYKI